ncbi:MAG TPA: response regulator [Candidatus Dormibacteraeota bacterium]|nr:response regulator [Candidatus Dormibacteraeota bacterium]
MLIVVALGGDVANRPTDVSEAVRAISREHSIVLTHINRPNSRGLGRRIQPYPEALPNAPGEAALNLEQALRQATPDRRVATVVTDVIVRLVPVGPPYLDTPEGRNSMAGLGWMVVADYKGLRRCIPMPEPQRVIQLEAIEELIAAGFSLLCPFRAGLTTTESTGFGPRPGEVQIDEDMAAAVLAERLGADLLVLLGKAEVERADVGWARGPVPPFGASSNDVLKKISGSRAEAACRFVEATGRRAAIGALAHAGQVVKGDSGIQVVARSPETADAGADGHSATVLVINDNEVALRLCRRVLEKSGYRVLTAADGLEGVWLALADSPDMILLDCAMPGMTSPEAMRLIKKQRPDVPIVITTVDPSEWNRQRYLGAGAARVLPLPFKVIDLVDAAARFAPSPRLQNPPWWQ